ncbi:Ribonuclease 3 [Manis pentadactyla]|nr:Ribonuclease 3 [Manis pentadactyla]
MTGCLGLLAFKTGATVPDHHQEMKKGLAQILEAKYIEFWNGEACMECGSLCLCASKKSRVGILPK